MKYVITLALGSLLLAAHVSAEDKPADQPQAKAPQQSSPTPLGNQPQSLDELVNVVDICDTGNK